MTDADLDFYLAEEAWELALASVGFPLDDHLDVEAAESLMARASAAHGFPAPLVRTDHLSARDLAVFRPLRSEVTLAPDGCTTLTALHETAHHIAHKLACVNDHGPVFAATWWALVRWHADAPIEPIELDAEEFNAPICGATYNAMIERSS